MDWQEVEAASWEGLLAAGVMEEEARLLAEACVDGEEVTLITALLNGDDGEKGTSRERVDLLFRVVDESPLSLTDWIPGIRALYGWLRAHGRKSSFPKALGYVSCCAETAASGIPFGTLSDTVQEMLGAYGFDGEEAD